jgi:hypothetical protein
MTMRKDGWRLGCLAVLLLAGCSYYRPVAISTVSFGPEKEELIGRVRGRAVHSYLLGIPTSDATLAMREAVENAKEKVGADQVLNVTVDQRISYYPFTILPIYATIETIVYGTAVRYKDPILRKIQDFTFDTPAVQPSDKSLSPASKPVSQPPDGVF